MMIFSLLPLLLTPAHADYQMFYQRFSADPSPLANSIDGRFYIYTTHDNLSDGYGMTDYNCLSSDDMVNWRDEGIIFSMDDLSPRWASHAWAQQVIQLPNNTFALYYAAYGGDNPGVGVAYSPTPAGPFIDVLGGPIMAGNDPGVLIDPDDSSKIILCSNNHTALCGLLDPKTFSSWAKEPTEIRGFNSSTWRWFEAPWIMKVNDTFYLSFMMSGTDIGYATSKSILGPYEKQSDPAMFSPPYDNNPPYTAATANNTQGWGNNHQGMTEYPINSGKYYFAYHNTKLRQDKNINTTSTSDRSIAIDRLYFNETANQILPVTSTPQWIVPLKYLNPYDRTPSFTLASTCGEMNTMITDDSEEEEMGLMLVNITKGSYTTVRFVDFGDQHPSSVSFRVAAEYDVRIRILQSKARGDEFVFVASCDVEGSGSFSSWKSVVCDLGESESRLEGVVESLKFVYDSDAVTEGILDILHMTHWKFDNGGEDVVFSPPPHTVPAPHLVNLRSKESNLLMACDGGRVSMVTSARDEGVELFLVDNDDGSYSILCNDEKLICADEGGSDVVIVSDDGDEGDDESFCRWSLIGVSDASYGFKSWTGGRGWLTVGKDGRIDTSGADYIHPDANRFVVDAESRFVIEENINWSPRGFLWSARTSTENGVRS